MTIAPPYNGAIQSLQTISVILWTSNRLIIIGLKISSPRKVGTVLYHQRSPERKNALGGIQFGPYQEISLRLRPQRGIGRAVIFQLDMRIVESSSFGNSYARSVGCILNAEPVAYFTLANSWDPRGSTNSSSTRKEGKLLLPIIGFLEIPRVSSY